MNIKKISMVFVVMALFLAPVYFVNAETKASACVDIQTTLTFGTGSSKKEQVILLQNFLKAQGYFNSESTGYFGPATLNAVKTFQKARGLDAVGNVGPQTRAEIKKVSCVVATMTPSVKPITQVAQTVAATVKSDLPYYAEDFSGWQKNWGVLTKTEKGSLLLKSSENETSFQATLPRSKDWTDFKYTASVSVTNGNVMLIGRKFDDKNLLICAFSGNNVQVQQRLDDKVTTLASANVPEMSSSVYFQKSLTVSMRVKGDTIGCSLLGSEDNVTYKGIDKKLMKGAIGIQSWYAAPGSAKLELTKVSVEGLN